MNPPSDEEKPKRRRTTRQLQEIAEGSNASLRSTFIVSGRLTNSRGEPLPEHRVRVLEAGLRDHKALGETTSNELGRYVFSFDKNGLRNGLNESANLLVEVYAPKDKKPAATSGIRFAVKPNSRIDIVVKSFASGAEAVENEVKAALGDTPLEELTDNELQRLSKLVKKPVKEIERLRQARTLSKDLGIPQTAAHAFILDRLPTDRKGLQAVHPDKLRKSIKAAQTRGEISPLSDSETEALIAQLHDQAVADLAEERLGNQHITFKAWFEGAGINRDEQRAVAQLWQANADSPVKFWQSLRRDQRVPRETLRALASAAQFGFLGAGNEGFIERLKTTASIKTPQEVARLSLEQLREISKSAERNPDRQEELAQTTWSRAAEAFPTTASLTRLVAETSGRTASTLRHIRDDQSFDLVRAPIDEYITRSRAVSDLDERERSQVVGALKRQQRLLRLAGNANGAERLRKSNINSAQDVVKMGRTAFLKEFGDSRALGEEAESVFDRAQESVATTMMLLAKYSLAFDTIGLPVLPTLPHVLDDVPNLKTLFGDQTLCACERCRSLLSPAAYLTDLLAFLENKSNNAGARNALAVLTDAGGGSRPARRPDLVDIKLSCENTNTIVPYIDLVLEVLENAVSPREGGAPQTRLDADELALVPEHLNEPAYERLSEEVYPFSLPFDPFAEETRAALEQLGTSRAELMETFAPISRSSDPNPDPHFSYLTDRRALESASIAGEVLGLTTAERKLIAAQPLRPGVFLPTARCWGFALADAGWEDRLAKVSEFLRRTGLEYVQLLELVRLKALDRAHPLSLHSDDPTECNPANIRINGLEAQLSILHRFIRLWRKLDWSMVDLDRALNALADKESNGATRLDEAFLVRLSHVKRLRANRTVPVVELLAWWSDIDTADYNADNLPNTYSLYSELFEKGTLPANRGLNLSNVRSGEAGVLGDQTAALCAGLRISESECSLLIGDRGLGVQEETVTLANISLLYRYVSLARYLGATIEELLMFRAVAGDPFVDRAGEPSTGTTLTFVDRWRRLQTSGFTIWEVAYLLMHEVRAEHPVAPVPQTAVEFIKGLQSDIKGLFSSITSEARTAEETEAAQIRFTQESGQLIVQRASEHFGVELSACDALLKTWLSISPDGSLHAILGSLIDLPLPGDAPGISEADLYSKQLRAYELLSKVAMIIKRLGLISLEELAWVFEQGAQPYVGWLDLAGLPLTPTPSGTLQNWERLVDFGRFRNSLLPERRADVYQLFEIGLRGSSNTIAREEREEYVAKLHELTGWPEDELFPLVGKLNSTTSHPLSVFDTHFPRHFHDEQLPLRVARCMALLRRLKLSVGQVSGLLTRDPSFDDSRRMARRATECLRAALPEARWRAAAVALRNRLRDAQRSALVDYLVFTMKLRDSGALFDRFLLDVEMTSCQKTTRVHSAILSVQLFVDRCLMNLEPSAALSTEGANQWGWLKSYSLWEANRKIFLYPENWLKQELRDDKTPFFKELETELMQNDISSETAESAFLHYLEKLDDVSRLQICGMYVEGYTGSSTDVPSVVHVFGRTRNTPHVYYYRRWIDGLQWTAWERVDVDIEGDHLIPIVYNRRLYLFWPIFTEEDEGPFKIEVFFKPLIDLLLLVMQVGQGLGATGYALLKSYNEVIEAFREIANTLPGLAGVEELQDALDDLQFNLSAFSFLDDDDAGTGVLGDALDIIAAALRLLLDMHPLKRMLDLLPAKIWDINLAWSEFKNGQWSARKISSQSLRFKDVAGPLLEMLGKVLSEFEIESSNGEVEKTAHDATFDRRKMFTFNARVEDGYLKVRTYITMYGLDPLSSDYDGSYDERLGTFKLDDCHGTLTAIYPNNENPFSYLEDLVEKLQEITFGSFQTAMQFVAGEPINSDDDPQGEFKRNFMPSLLEGVDRDNYRVLTAHQYRQKEELEDLFFLQDATRTFWFFQNSFQLFYHPYVCSFVRAINRNGVESLFHPDLQELTSSFFDDDYDPTADVETPYPLDDVDYQSKGSYSQYNWELFVHAPMLIAERLSANQKFEAAQRWFHYVFDPTDHRDQPVPGKFWRPRPFIETTREQYQRESIRELLNLLAGSRGSSAQQELETQVHRWRRDPFNPHSIARLRTTAYQKGVVMRYIDNLLAWGDQQFRRDTFESINRATQLYLLAAAILGPRPKDVYARKQPAAMSYRQLKPLDAFSNALVELEHWTLPWTWSWRPQARFERLLQTGLFKKKGPEGPGDGKEKQPDKKKPDWTKLIDTGWFNHIANQKSLYFCIPRNESLLRYWDLLEDRLFKIRHCMNIEGVRRDLLPGEALLDPEMLIRARLQGVDLEGVLNDLGSTMPRYRFAVLVQKATELCGEAKALGAALLSALEKRDAERLALLRQTHEIKLLAAARRMRQLQVEEAKSNLEALRRSAVTIQTRRDFYATNLMIPFSPLEMAQLALQGSSLALQAIEAGVMLGAVSLSLLPTAITGFPLAATMQGGQNVADSADRAARNLGILASVIGSAGSLVGTVAGFERRSQEWDLQKRIAEAELKQMESQIKAAETRLEIATRDLQNHELQIDQSNEVSEFLRTKVTNQQLYEWMTEQLASVYFQSYQLAYDMAKRAERACRFEMGDFPESSRLFIQFGYWDSLKQGLLAGEQLHHDLKRLEVSYFDRNEREYELTKHISLIQLNPVGLLQLKQTGSCQVSVPEAMFDIDYPGHYMRRLKLVSITIPCVTGPYTGAPCTLTLTKSSVRHSDQLLGGRYERDLLSPPDPRFVDVLAPATTIATSSAQNDSGLFEANLRDERYLPFEGAGAISEWTIDLPKDYRPFDYETITDVVLHIRYTARASRVPDLKRQAEAELATAINQIILAAGEHGLARSFSARHEFPDRWHRFLNPVDARTTARTLELDLAAERYPFVFQGKTIEINRIGLFMLVPGSSIPTELELFVTATGDPVNDPSVSPNTPTRLSKDPALGELLIATITYSGRKSTGKWTIKARNSDIAAIESAADLVVVTYYTVRA